MWAPNYTGHNFIGRNCIGPKVLACVVMAYIACEPRLRRLIGPAYLAQRSHRHMYGHGCRHGLRGVGLGSAGL